MKFNEMQVACLFGLASNRAGDKIVDKMKEDGLTDEEISNVMSVFVTNSLILGRELAEMVNQPRGFEVAKGFGDKDVTLPHRGTSEAAGYDFHSLDTVTVQPHKSVVISTGVKAYMPIGEVLKIYPRSSMGIKRGLVLANGTAIIDSDYYGNKDNDGHIMIALYNMGSEEQTIKAGERIAQGIFEPFFDCGDEPDEVRSGGIGSTGV